MNHAKFAQAAYALNLTGKNKNKRIEVADEHIKDTGFKTHGASNREVSLYLNDGTREAIIAHRGTAFNNRRDIAGDLNFIAGNEGHSTEFERRRARTERIIKNVPRDYKVHLNGYSYGGATVVDTLSKSPKLREKITGEVHLYNPLTRPYQPEIIPGKKESPDDVIKFLNDKITVHRTAQDIVSTPGTYGKVETHEAKYKHKGLIPEHLKAVFETANQLSTHSLKNFI